MPKRRVNMRVSDLKNGKSAWLIGREDTYWNTKDKPIHIRCLGVDKDGWLEFSQYTQGDLYKGHTGQISLRDRGVRPLNYDDRPTQIFATKKICLKRIAQWQGKNPNFLKGP